MKIDLMRFFSQHKKWELFLPVSTNITHFLDLIDTEP